MKSFLNVLVLITVLSISQIGEVVFARESGEKRNFTITGYYSPLPNQNFYVTGGYESEIRLNGEGIVSADSTPVFPGMIAAPSNYAFGTKICLKEFGCGVVHDRGGAIVNKGERELARHDRLDLWMGFGEEGLLRALALGVKHWEGEIFPENSSVEIGVNFSAVLSLVQILDLPKRIVFEENLYVGKTGEEVITLQKALDKLGFYSKEIDGVFDEELEESIFSFQKKYFVLSDESDVGAGFFGPQTRMKLSDILHKKETQEQIAKKWAEFHFEKDLTKGKRSADVFKLQEMLIQKEFMNHVPTGYFGKITKEALILFQLEEGLIKNRSSVGAGIVGPQTRECLNELIFDEKESFRLEKNLVASYQRERSVLHYFAGDFVTEKVAMNK
ncbi:peptidoglycan-binding protein [Candidatus Gracilibacteria bacterium]|nr:peptidoglycan-binding protein [Candidatus Gracilibacteria bacterium]